MPSFLGVVAQSVTMPSIFANVVVPITQDVPVGTVLVAVVALGTVIGSGVTLTDSQGNTWTIRASAGFSGPLLPSASIVTCTVTHALTVAGGDSFSVFPGPLAPFGGWWGFQVLAFSGVTVSSLANHSDFASPTPTAGMATTSTIRTVQTLIVGCFVTDLSTGVSTPTPDGSLTPVSTFQLAEAGPSSPSVLGPPYFECVTYYAFVAPGTYAPSCTFAPSADQAEGATVYMLADLSGLKVSYDRSPVDQRPALAFVDPLTGGLEVNRYDDAFPEAVATVSTLETSGVTSCSLRFRTRMDIRGISHKGDPSQPVLDLLYCHTGKTVKWRISRDLGRTWSVATIIATGYTDVDHQLDETDGMLVAVLFDDATSRYLVSVGTLDAAGTSWSWSAPSAIVSSAKTGGSLKRRADGTWELAYVTTGNAATIIRCRNLSTTGTGTWS